MSYNRNQKRKFHRSLVERYPKTLLSTWEVTADYADDYEIIGVFKGHIFDIAKKLSGIGCYILHFERTTKLPIINNKFKELPHENNTVKININGQPLEIYEAGMLIKRLAIKDQPKCMWNLVVSNQLRLEFLNKIK